MEELKVRAQTFYIIKLDKINYFQEFSNNDVCYTFNFSFAKRYRFLKDASRDIEKLKSSFPKAEVFEIKMRKI